MQGSALQESHLSSLCDWIHKYAKTKTKWRRRGNDDDGMQSINDDIGYQKKKICARMSKVGWSCSILVAPTPGERSHVLNFKSRTGHPRRPCTFSSGSIVNISNLSECSTQISKATLKDGHVIDANSVNVPQLVARQLRLPRVVPLVLCPILLLHLRLRPSSRTQARRRHARRADRAQGHSRHGRYAH
jgi:hypothetical protein